MTSPQLPEYRSSHPLSASREGRVAGWVRDNGRVLGYAGAAVAVFVAGSVVWQANRRTVARRAEGALGNAQVAVYQGNAQAAERALRDVTTRYAGTSAGAQAQLLLAQALYDQGKFADGLSALRRADPPPEFTTAFRLMTAAGEEGAGRGAVAAKIYEELAGDAEAVPRRRDELKAAAARAYQLANDRANAARLWRSLVETGAGAIVDEARVRAGELAPA